MAPGRSGIRCVLAWAFALLPVPALLPAGVHAQEATGRLAGQVVDASRNAAVGGARVEIVARDRQTSTDSRGRFRFDAVPEGRHELRVSFLGFETRRLEVEVAAGETAEVTVRLTPRPLRLRDLEVTTRSLSWFAGFLDRRRSRTGHFFTRQEIAEADVDHLTELLRSAEGVRIGTNSRAPGASRRYPQFYYQGPAYTWDLRRVSPFCRPVIFLNGERLRPGRAYRFFNEIPPEKVLALEVYYRGEDVPESLSLRLPHLPGAPTRYGFPDPGPSGADPGPAGGDLGGGVLESRSAGTAGALELGVPRRIQAEDEEQRLALSPLAGLYEKVPRLEHCGAVFVWTVFYLGEDR